MPPFESPEAPIATPAKSLSVVVLGASPNPDRFSYRAMQMLADFGHRAIPINPTATEILGQPCYKSIADIRETIDTVTLYLGAARSEPLIDEILAAHPRRLIINPGAENDHLTTEATKRDIKVVHDCTLVMLQSGTF